MSPALQTTRIIRRPNWDFEEVTSGHIILTLLPDTDWNDPERIRRFLTRFRSMNELSCDCRQVDITSTAAIGWLITLYRHCLSKGIEFAVINPDASCIATYRAQGLDGILPIAA